MQSIKYRTAVVVMAALASVCALPAVAADSADSGSSDNAKTQSTEQQFTDKQLKQFVKAQSNVQDVMNKWDDKVSKADDKKAAKKKENEAMLKAVKDSGLKPKQYNEIAKQAQDDPKLTKRIQSFMTPQ